VPDLTEGRAGTGVVTRCAVTGAGGFLGAHFGRRLVSSGVEVHGLSRVEPHGIFSVWQRCDVGDLRQMNAVMRACRPQAIAVRHGAKDPRAQVTNGLAALRCPAYDQAVGDQIDRQHDEPEDELDIARQAWRVHQRNQVVLDESAVIAAFAR